MLILASHFVTRSSDNLNNRTIVVCGFLMWRVEDCEIVHVDCKGHKIMHILDGEGHKITSKVYS